MMYPSLREAAQVRAWVAKFCILALATTSVGAFGCTSRLEESEPVDSASSALSRTRWRQIRKRGGACKFEADASGPADSFVISNGEDISIVFTRLGAATKLGPAGRRVWSVCNFEVPVGVPSGSYIAGWHQTLNYGAVKPVGVAAGLGLKSALESALESTATPAALALPGIDVRFPREVATDSALEVAASDFLLDPERPRHQQWRRQACRQGRDRDVTFVGGAYTWSERTADDAPPVILAIDGLDARVDLAADVQPCPETP